MAGLGPFKNLVESFRTGSIRLMNGCHMKPEKEWLPRLIEPILDEIDVLRVLVLAPLGRKSCGLPCVLEPLLVVAGSEVRQSQARRWVVYEALRNGAYYPWDFQPLQKASERYMRNHMDLNTLEESQRFPRGE